ncbi:MAG: tetratricopeptide repeat protein, partial [Gemmatimonadota bacterium]
MMKRIWTGGCVVATVALLAACATGGMRSAAPENIPALEQRVAAEPDDAQAATTLGVAYFNAQRHEDARNTLARLVAGPGASGDAYLYLGLANEELKDWTAARAAYEKFLATGAAGELEEQIRGRLVLVARQQLRQEARLVLEREQQLSEEPPTERTVAVMPFRLVGVSEELSPLQTALSDMIITDLSVSPALISIERVKINAMIGEMLLAQAGLAEASTGARVGRLLKAEHVVQGVLAQSGERELRMDATVLNTASRASAGTFGQNEQLEQIFALEKQIVFNIFDAVGVTLTAAEREKINENRTANLIAFLAYGRGLEALDRGNYQQAQTFFRQASQLDPNFQRVQEMQQETQVLEKASGEAPAEVGQQAQAPAAGTGDLT